MALFSYEACFLLPIHRGRPPHQRVTSSLEAILRLVRPDPRAEAESSTQPRVFARILWDTHVQANLQWSWFHDYKLSKLFSGLTALDFSPDEGHKLVSVSLRLRSLVQCFVQSTSHWSYPVTPSMSYYVNSLVSEG